MFSCSVVLSMLNVKYRWRPFVLHITISVKQMEWGFKLSSFSVYHTWNIWKNLPCKGCWNLALLSECDMQASCSQYVSQHQGVIVSSVAHSLTVKGRVWWLLDIDITIKSTKCSIFLYFWWAKAEHRSRELLNCCLIVGTVAVALQFWWIN
jgi:hypothetical protein